MIIPALASPVQAWAALAAPVVGVYAIARGRSDQFGLAADGPVGSDRTLSWTLISVIVAVGLLAAVALAPTAFSAIWLTALFGVLAYLAAVDLRLLAVPVWPCIMLVCAGIAVSEIEGGLLSGARSGLAAILAWAAFRLLDAVYKFLRKRSGLGSGDALIAAVIASVFGVQGLAFSLVAGCAGTLLLLLLTRANASSRAWPLAPGLAAGSLIFYFVDRGVF